MKIKPSARKALYAKIEEEEKKISEKVLSILRLQPGTIEPMHAENSKFEIVAIDGKLISLYFERYKLENIDFSHPIFDDLIYLRFNNFSLDHFDFKNLKNLRHLSLHCNDFYTSFGSLDLRGFESLETLICTYVGVDELLLGELPKLTKIKINNNEISDLDLSGVKNLEWLECRENNLDKLELDHLKQKLQIFSCTHNNLTQLGFVDFPELGSISCGFNQLEELPLSNLPSLYALNCGGNNLTELNCSNMPNLKFLRCSDNKISKLDIENSPRIKELVCGNNELKRLDLSKHLNLSFLDHTDNEGIVINLSDQKPRPMIFS